MSILMVAKSGLETSVICHFIDNGYKVDYKRKAICIYVFWLTITASDIPKAIIGKKQQETDLFDRLICVELGGHDGIRVVTCNYLGSVNYWIILVIATLTTSIKCVRNSRMPVSLNGAEHYHMFRTVRFAVQICAPR